MESGITLRSNEDEDEDIFDEQEKKTNFYYQIWPIWLNVCVRVCNIVLNDN